MSLISHSQDNSRVEDDVPQSPMKKVSEKAIGVPNPQTDTFRSTSQKRYLQNLEKVEAIVDELQERFSLKIKGWNRNILVEMAWLHTDKRNGFTPATIKLLEERLKKKGIMSYGKTIKYNNLRKKIKSMYENGIIKRLPERVEHGYGYVLANMQDLCVEKDNKESSIKERKKSLPRVTSNDTIIEEKLYEIIGPRDSKGHNDSVLTDKENYPEPEFHHITLLSYLESPEEDYEKLAESKDWTMSSEENRGLIYQGRISRHRTFTIIVYPVGTVEIMIRCTKDPFRWYPREDWIVLYDICSSILNLLKEYLERGISSNPLVDSTYLDWTVTQLHLGYDIPVKEGNKRKNKRKRKGTKILDLTKFVIPIKVRNLDGISCQVYVKRMPYKGTTIRLEEHIDFGTKGFDSVPQHDESSTNLIAPTLKSLKNTVIPKSIDTILDNVYSR